MTVSLRAFAFTVVCWLVCGVAYASDFNASFARSVCDLWSSDRTAALSLLTENGWTDAGTQQNPLKSEPELQLSYRLHGSQLHPAEPAQGIVPTFTLEEAAFGNLRITQCEVQVTTEGAPFMTLSQTEQWLRSEHFEGLEVDASDSPLGMTIFRAARNDDVGRATWVRAGTWHALAFPNMKIWSLRFQSAVRVEH